MPGSAGPVQVCVLAYHHAVNTRLYRNLQTVMCTAAPPGVAIYSINARAFLPVVCSYSPVRVLLP